MNVNCNVDVVNIDTTTKIFLLFSKKNVSALHFCCLLVIFLMILSSNFYVAVYFVDTYIVVVVFAEWTLLLA